MANHPHNPERPVRQSMADAVAKGDIKKIIKGLTPRQRRFAEEYIIDYNGAAAVLRAGYSPKYNDRQAHILLQHEGIQAYINHLGKEKVEDLVGQTVDVEFVIGKILKALSFAEDGKNLTAMLRASELLARHLGMLTDRQEITGKDGEAIAIEQRKIEETAESFTNLLKNLRKRADAEGEVR